MIRPAAPDPDAARRGVERTRPARTPDDPAAPIVEVVGLGPGAAELVTDGTLSVLRSGAPTFVRTRRHPSASVLPDGTVAFDDVYEQADLIESVYRTIVESLVESAEEHRRVVYAVPGSPVVAEHTVELLIADDRVRTVLHPALSFLDLTWIRLRIDPVELGVRLVDGHRFEERVAEGCAPMLVGQCDSNFVLSDIKLAFEDPPVESVVLLQRLGLPDERIVEVAWEDMDRTVDADHLTSLWIPSSEDRDGLGTLVVRFAALLEDLRANDPWKAEQTHDSLKRFLLEESYEVLESIDGYDPDTGVGAEALTSELGDLLYQVVFHSALGAEAGWFELSDVVSSIHDKLVSRNDDLLRVTGGRVADAGVDGAVIVWEASKRAEHGRSSAFDGIPHALPAMTRAMKVQRKAEALGLERAAEDRTAELGALAAAVASAPADLDAVGALLDAVVDVARRACVDGEDALRRRIDADELRYRSLEEPD